MTGDDIPPPPPPPPSTTADKLIPFSITNKVPIKLNLEKHNYTSWSSFFKIHLGSLGLKSHIEGASSSAQDPEWCKLDDLIKMWILGSLCDSLQEQVVSTPGNAKALWDHLQGLFHDNKDARAINLDNELRSIKIGSMSINEYCTKIKSMADRLKNLGSLVSEKNLVIYAVNGLDSRFTTIVKIIRHREPLPTFETARNMLLLEESTLNEQTNGSNTFDSSASSPTVLVTSHSLDSKGNNTSNKSQSLNQLCNHFNKGSCKFGDRCKFIHDHRNRVGLQTKNPNSSLGQNNYLGRMAGNNRIQHNPMHWAPPGVYNNRMAQQHNPYQPTLQLIPTQHLNHQPYNPPAQQQTQHVLYTAQSQQPNSLGHNSNSGPGLLGPAPAIYPTQATSLPSAFSTMTLQDPTWNMDTGLLDSPYPPSM